MKPVRLIGYFDLAGATLSAIPTKTDLSMATKCRALHREL